MSPKNFARIMDEIVRTPTDWVQLRQIVKELKSKIEYEEIDN